MAKKPTVQQCYAMIDYYIKAYKAHYAGQEPVLNRHAARWGFESVLMGLPPEEVKKLIDFYFTTKSQKRHALDWFFYNYEKLIESASDLEKDRARREKLREESEARAAEWRARGNTGIAGN